MTKEIKGGDAPHPPLVFVQGVAGTPASPHALRHSQGGVDVLLFGAHGAGSGRPAGRPPGAKKSAVCRARLMATSSRSNVGMQWALRDTSRCRTEQQARRPPNRQGCRSCAPPWLQRRRREPTPPSGPRASAGIGTGAVRDHPRIPTWSKTKRREGTLEAGIPCTMVSLDFVCRLEPVPWCLHLAPLTSGAALPAGRFAG